jgi:hypothetical protein
LFSTLPDRARALGELRGTHEAVLFIGVVMYAAAVPLLMRLPLTRSAALLTRDPQRRTPRPGEVERLDRLIELAPIVAHPLVRRGCLTRGVTLYWFLRRAGIDVELRFGLDPGGDRLDRSGDRLNPGGDYEADGHCWLTLGGEPYLERLDPRPRFVEVYRIPSPAA